MSRQSHEIHCSTCSKGRKKGLISIETDYERSKWVSIIYRLGLGNKSVFGLGNVTEIVMFSFPHATTACSFNLLLLLKTIISSYFSSNKYYFPSQVFSLALIFFLWHLFLSYIETVCCENKRQLPSKTNSVEPQVLYLHPRKKSSNFLF